MGNTYSNLLFHIVFSTKERQPLIDEQLCERLYPFIGGTVRDEGGVLYDIGGTADHMHMLLRWKTADGIADLVRNVKSRSSGWVHETYDNRRAFAWQAGYGAFSVSHSLKAAVATYIQNQAKHHARRSFKDELLHMLKVNEIEYDEKYVWD